MRTLSRSGLVVLGMATIVAVSPVIAVAQEKLAGQPAVSKSAVNANKDVVVLPRSTSTSPAATATGPAATATAASQRMIRFQFHAQPWKDVLEWFAKQADFSLIMDPAAPPGTFNYSDTHEFTPSEAIDLLNTVLHSKGYTLLRHNRILMLYNLEDPFRKALSKP